MSATAIPPAIPDEIALLCEFANSLDLRRFVQGGVPREARDEFAGPEALATWMRAHELLASGVRLSDNDHRKALELRGALRGLLQLAPADRPSGPDAARFSAAAAHFPVIVEVSASHGVRLRPDRGGAVSGLGRILADFHHAAETGRLDRLKVCASDECRWVFYDHSKPATRRWCSSTLCGNREKTRAYRTRRRTGA